jgi:hypothetical protein
MALFSECMQRCGKKGIDSAGIVRDAMLRLFTIRSFVFLYNDAQFACGVNR